MLCVPIEKQFETDIKGLKCFRALIMFNIHKISFFFILASAANIIWIFLWHFEQILSSLLVMLVLFVSLFVMYLRLNIGKEKVSLKKNYSYMFQSVFISDG